VPVGFVWHAVGVLIAYVDESGDTGPVSKSGASACFALGCVLVRSADWNSNFDDLIGFRRSLRDDFGPLMRQEMKANHLIRNGGGLRRYGLSPAQRQLIYRYHLNQIERLGARAFAVVVDKASADVSGSDCLEMAWVTLLQRLERTTSADGSPVMVIHDEGEDAAVRKILRKSRRHMTAGSMFGSHSRSVPLKQLVEDPVPRVSHESYFLQLADLVAYAGWRTHMAPGPGAALVAPAGIWRELGGAIHADVSKYARRLPAPGVVLRY
jgi:hypothetical protein